MELTREEWQRLETLFAQALDLPASARRRLVERLPSQLRAELENLLAAHERTQGFLSEPVSVTAPPRDAATLPEGSLLGPWRVLRPLGRGGMGEVYLAARADGAFDMQAALKLIKRGMDSDAMLQRFLRERRILAALHHPRIARLLDAGSAPDGRPWLAMEFVDGEPIGDWCMRNDADVPQRLHLMIAVCEAVDEAHRQLVVHRDLKPSNVLVDSAGEVKLLDFGVAKLLGEEAGDLTLRAEGPALTPAYAAPEQLLGEPVSTGTDVYALGAILYELLAGRPPHLRHSLVAAAASLVAQRETLMAPSSAARRCEALGEQKQRSLRASALRGDLDLIVLKALRREPQRRYRSAAALAHDLRSYLDHRPVAARPESSLYRARRFARRNWISVSATALVLLAVIGGAVIAGWQAARASAEARRAEAIKQFLLGMFEQADPEHTQGETLSARELVTRASDSALRGAPLERADMLETLARVHTSLGMYERAATLARDALDLRREQLDAQDPRVAGSIEALGAVLARASDDVAAEPLFEEARRIYLEAGDELGAARSGSALATVLVNRGGEERALALQQQALDSFRKLRGEHDPETALQRVLLAERLENVARYAEAEQELRAALKALSASLGPENFKVGRAHLSLGSVLDRLGDVEQSLHEHDLALAIMRKTYGDDHSTVAGVRFSRAITLGRLGRHAEAERDLRETLRIFPADSYYAAQSLRYLGTNLIDQERYAEAAEILVKATAALGRSGGEDDIQQYRALADQARARMHGGDAQAAEPLFREAIAQLEARAGPQTYSVRNPLKYFGECLLMLRRYDEALATLRRTVALEVQLFGAEHRDLALTRRLLTENLLALHTPEALSEAGASSELALALYRRHFPAQLAYPLLLSAEVHAARGEAAQARHDVEEALPLLRSELEATGPGVLGQRRARLERAQQLLAQLRIPTAVGR